MAGTRRLRYRVVRTIFDIAAPMYVQVESGYLEEDGVTFVPINTVGHSLTPEQTQQLLQSPPAPDATSRYADLQLAMQTILQEAGIIGGSLL